MHSKSLPRAAKAAPRHTVRKARSHTSHSHTRHHSIPARHFQFDDSGSAAGGKHPKGPGMRGLGNKQANSRPSNNNNKNTKPNAPNAKSRFEQIKNNSQFQKPGHQLSRHQDQHDQQQQQQQQKPQGSKFGNISTKAPAGPLAGVPLNDFDALFKNSSMSKLFSAGAPDAPAHHSYFERMNDGDTAYFIGTRHMIDPHSSTQDKNFCLISRTIDRQESVFHDRLVALDYQSGLPFDQYLTTKIDPDGQRATAVDKDQETGEVMTRTFIRLRGEPWKWHSAVAMSKIEPRLDQGLSEEYLKSLPETYSIARLQFNANGFIGERIIRQGDNIVLTVIDDLKLTTKAVYEQRVDKIFKEYSNMLTQEIEQAAKHIDEDDDEAMANFEKTLGGIDKRLLPERFGPKQ